MIIRLHEEGSFKDITLDGRTSKLFWKPITPIVADGGGKLLQSVEVLSFNTLRPLTTLQDILAALLKSAMFEFDEDQLACLVEEGAAGQRIS